MSLLSLLTPSICFTCGDQLTAGETILCARCAAQITYITPNVGGNIQLRERIFPRTAPIRLVDAMTTYRHDSVTAKIIRTGKYGGRPELIYYIAKIYAKRLAESGMLADVDALQPVPMHWLKRLKRGYNQAELIALTISKATGIPVIKAVKAVKSHTSQTRQTAQQRTTNLVDNFKVSKPALIQGKHIAVIDDIITTGSTISEVVGTVYDARPRAISVLALAAAPTV